MAVAMSALALSWGGAHVAWAVKADGGYEANVALEEK